MPVSFYTVFIEDKSVLSKDTHITATAQPGGSCLELFYIFIIAAIVTDVQSADDFAKYTFVAWALLMKSYYNVTASKHVAYKIYTASYFDVML